MWVGGGGAAPRHTDVLTRRRGSGRMAVSNLSDRIFFRDDWAEPIFAMKNQSADRCRSVSSAQHLYQL